MRDDSGKVGIVVMVCIISLLLVMMPSEEESTYNSNSVNAVDEIGTIVNTTKFSDINTMKAQETIKPYNSTTKKNNYGNSTSKKSNYVNSTTKNTYESYDDGYDDIYMDGDYDDDRYNSDSDYADGVDDAMDEFEGDW